MHLRPDSTVKTINLTCIFSLKEVLVGILDEYFEFGCEWENLTRFVSTRLLSLEQCCDKELRKFEASKSMFLCRSAKDSSCDIRLIKD